ncbi:MAG TPA: hypothetical protein VFR74_15170 [Jiangellales bacterium]|nr:hypothetical protein [Jiangellales bacterium]
MAGRTTQLLGRRLLVPGVAPERNHPTGRLVRTEHQQPVLRAVVWMLQV